MTNQLKVGDLVCLNTSLSMFTPQMVIGMKDGLVNTRYLIKDLYISNVEKSKARKESDFIKVSQLILQENTYGYSTCPYAHATKKSDAKKIIEALDFKMFFYLLAEGVYNVITNNERHVGFYDQREKELNLYNYQPYISSAVNLWLSGRGTKQGNIKDILTCHFGIYYENLLHVCHNGSIKINGNRVKRVNDLIFTEIYGSTKDYSLTAGLLKKFHTFGNYKEVSIETFIERMQYEFNREVHISLKGFDDYSESPNQPNHDEDDNQSTQTGVTDMATKLFKVILADKTEAYGTYLATDDIGRLVLQMKSLAPNSNEPLIQAFHPKDVEEVLPWTFAVSAMAHESDVHFVGYKDCVKVGDMFLTNIGKIVSVVKVNTKFCTNATFKGLRIQGVPFDSKQPDPDVKAQGDDKVAGGTVA